MFSWMTSWYYGEASDTEQELEKLSGDLAELDVADRPVYLIGVNKDCSCPGMRRRNFGVYSSLKRALTECTLIAVHSGCTHLEVRRNRLDCPRSAHENKSRWFYSELERAEEEGHFCAMFVTTIEHGRTAGPAVSLNQYRAWVTEHNLDAAPLDALVGALEANNLGRYTRRAFDAARLLGRG